MSESTPPPLPTVQSAPSQAKAPVKLIVGIVIGVLVLVFGGIAALFGFGTFFLTKTIDDAKLQKAELDIKMLEIALKSYQRNNTSKLPTQEQSLEALVKKPTVEPVPARWRAYLAEKMFDPWGLAYEYRIPAVHSGKEYDLFSLGPDGVESEDDIGNW